MATNVPPNNTVPILDQRLIRRIAGNFRLTETPEDDNPLRVIGVIAACPEVDCASIRLHPIAGVRERGGRGSGHSPDQYRVNCTSMAVRRADDRDREGPGRLLAAPVHDDRCRDEGLYCWVQWSEKEAVALVTVAKKVPAV